MTYDLTYLPLAVLHVLFGMLGLVLLIHLHHYLKQWRVPKDKR